MFLFWMKGNSRVNGKADDNRFYQPSYTSIKEANQAETLHVVQLSR